MNNEYYGAASTPTDDFLAHYGIKGMKWGVRRAIVKGGEKALRKQYIKAQRKLEKLDKQASKAATYKKRAIRMGIGAGVVGGLAVAGTSGVSRAISGAGKLGRKIGIKGAGGLGANVAGAVQDWGRATNLSGSARKLLDSNAVQNLGRSYHGVGGQVVRTAGAKVGEGAAATSKALKGVSNNTLARIGAGAIGAGLAAGAARNAYKAKTAQKKAQQFRAEMNKAFAGTKYANGAPSVSQKKKRKNRG